MNKSDLVSRIATRTGVTKKVANDVLSATMETIVDSVCEGNKVMLVGFGSFTPKSLPAREGRNPRTGEKLQIQASRVPGFSVAKTFKDRVNTTK
ncbi:histone-like bacterial DNA-binding protein [Pavlovales sp. CCMP2436]|nr:histone-like bacterial DNA-binding protein [Pavlovales sp. CCMP2436]